MPKLRLALVKWTEISRENIRVINHKNLRCTCTAPSSQSHVMITVQGNSGKLMYHIMQKVWICYSTFMNTKFVSIHFISSFSSRAACSCEAYFVTYRIWCTTFPPNGIYYNVMVSMWRDIFIIFTDGNDMVYSWYSLMEMTWHSLEYKYLQLHNIFLSSLSLTCVW